MRRSLFVLSVFLFIQSSYPLLQLQAIQGYGNHEPPGDSGGDSFLMLLLKMFMQDVAGSDGVEHILATGLPSLRDDGLSLILSPFAVMFALAIRPVLPEPFAARDPPGRLDLWYHW